ncbi:MAG TPA: Na/Pi symporter [Opitutus sp.]|nr:Na/Pi symporter [Opitutus sp.]
MLELFALFLVGVSLFLYGVDGVKTHLQGLTSRRLRRKLAEWSRRPLIAGGWGFLFGAVTQSSTAVAFIVASMVSSGLMTVPRALPIVACANLGTVMLVLFVSFNVQLAFLYVLGLAGLALAFNLGSPRVRPLLTALFSVGLLFFGLQLMKDAFAPLPRYGWFNDVAAFIHGSTLAVFFAGALLRVLLQSSSGIAVIAIAFAHGGLLTPPQAAMMIFGTGLGVGVSVFLLSANLRGVPRQIALFQALINASASVTLALLFYVERATGWPLVLAFTHVLADTPTLQMAFAFVVLQAVAVVLALSCSRPAAGWLGRLAPPSQEQDLARPRFLDEHAIGDPESALDLAEQEQRRLLHHLPAQLDTIRRETSTVTRIPAETWHRATVAVSAAVQAYLRDVADQPSDHDTSARLLALEGRQSLIISLDETIYQFVTTFETARAAAPSVGPFLENLAESLHVITVTALDTLASGDATDRVMLLGMTADRGDLMERLRRNLIGGSQPLDHQQKAHLFYLTSLFERAVWLVRQFGQSLPVAQ